MNIFRRKKPTEAPRIVDGAERMLLAEMALNAIADGVIIADLNNVIKMINPAATRMMGYTSANDALGLSVDAVLHFENNNGGKIQDQENLVLKALTDNQPFSIREYVLISAQNQKYPVAVTVTPTGSAHGEKIVTFRDIAKELEEEGEQAEFISTASHEMRTPVASIEGYLSLALNPQTATIDERARKYLEEAHKSSQHLGRLFQDLLDVTKIDDNKIRLRLTPVEVVGLVKSIADGQAPSMMTKKLRYTFGMVEQGVAPERRMEQVVYGSLDVDFLREVLNNLIENAVKYTPEGGAIWVNARGDGDRILINVTDTGIGISPEDLKHVFQKFYRVDNSQTRTIGGTGLGLYLVKQRTEAMGGKVWAESSFGEGSTFYLSFPRLTQEEYDRRKQVQANQEAMTPAQAATILQNRTMIQAPVTQSPTIVQTSIAQNPVTVPTSSIQTQAATFPPNQPMPETTTSNPTEKIIS